MAKKYKFKHFTDASDTLGYVFRELIETLEDDARHSRESRDYAQARETERRIADIRAVESLALAAPELRRVLIELVRCIKGGDKTSGISMDDALIDAADAISESDIK